MSRDFLVDTGPFIVLVDRHDRYHRWARSRFGEILPPLQTCDAVLTEACFLANQIPGACRQFWVANAKRDSTHWPIKSSVSLLDSAGFQTDPTVQQLREAADDWVISTECGVPSVLRRALLWDFKHKIANEAKLVGYLSSCGP